MDNTMKVHCHAPEQNIFSEEDQEVRIIRSEEEENGQAENIIISKMIELSLDIPHDLKPDSSFPVSSEESLIEDSLLDSNSFTEEPILESSSVLITPMVNSPKVDMKQGAKKSKLSKNMIKSP